MNDKLEWIRKEAAVVITRKSSVETIDITPETGTKDLSNASLQFYEYAKG
jgi:hypothetical protein